MKRTESLYEFAPSILVLTDGSNSSEEALRWAAHMASHHHANLKVLYPYRLTQLNGKGEFMELRKNIESEARGNFEKVAENVFRNGNQPPFDFLPEVGFMNDRVYSHTKRTDVLMVVISKKMANANKEAVNELVDRLPMPLVIVPPAVESRKTELITS